MHSAACRNLRRLGKTFLYTVCEVVANGRTLAGWVDFSGQGIVDIEYSVDGGAVLRNYFLYGEPPFNWEDVKKWTGKQPF